jgi:hypothetical protein
MAKERLAISPRYVGDISPLQFNLLIKALSYLDGRDLVRCSGCCWVLFAVCNIEELWKDLVLLRFVDEDSKIATFTFRGSWKSTWLNPLRPRAECFPTVAKQNGAGVGIRPIAAHRDASVSDNRGDHSWALLNVCEESAQRSFARRKSTDPLRLGVSASLDCRWLLCSSTVNWLTRSGDFLCPPPYAVPKPKDTFRYYNVRGMDLSQLPMNLCGVPRVHASQLSRERFRTEFEIPNRPVLITGLMDNWPAMESWRLDNFCSEYGDVPLKTNSRSTNGKRFRMRTYDFLAYCAGWNGEKPLYIFDKKVFLSHPALLDDYTVPDYFTEDLFELMEEDERPDYRWLLLGPNGSGSPFHTDPHNSSAWNAVIEGCKRVSFYPPDVIPPGVDEELIHTEYYASDDTMDWYRNTYPKLKPEERPAEVLVQRGEVLFIPSGWWHQIMNIGHTIAVTQNFCSTITFPRVAQDMNAHAGRSVRKDFKIALIESEEFQHLAQYITVSKKKKSRLES